jgi:phosphoribosylamine--glycine ligase
MKRRKCSFKGVLYAGLMMTNQGPRVLEFNVRLGDPEAQPLLFRLKTDLLDLLEACVDERLEEFEGKIEFDSRPSVAVVACARGYPGNYPKGDRIDGLSDVAKLDDVMVFHGGTKRDGDRIVTDGGRVLAVTAKGDDFAQARLRAYDAMGQLKFVGMHYRKDIGGRKNQPAAE